MKLNMYSVWHNYFYFIIILLLVSKGHHQPNIYKHLKTLVHII